MVAERAESSEEMIELSVRFLRPDLDSPDKTRWIYNTETFRLGGLSHGMIRHVVEQRWVIAMMNGRAVEIVVPSKARTTSRSLRPPREVTPGRAQNVTGMSHPDPVI